ncbi:glycosyltransferase [Priestia filamentosa]|uniref:glycosyltransferase n=1 Tax=Priestia filamentosa TaxID=1402861 RepID=UPI0039799BF4
MIVKDEENHLENCLNSVRDVVDELIIVDTGSKDKTKDIATKFGAQVFDLTWENDFSKARNYSLDKATKDWILWLDADETLEKINIDELKEKMENHKKLAFEIEIYNQSIENKTPFIHKSIRFFKNHENIRFMNKIHEQPSINKKPIPYYDIEGVVGQINHVGYREDIAKGKNKKQRNFTILKDELKRNPHDKFLHFNVANEYLKNEDYHNALYHYKIATQNKADKQMLSHSLLRMVLALYNLKRYEEMFTLLEEGQRYFPDYTDILYFKADILEQFGRKEEAIILYEKCLEKGNPKKNYVTRQGVGDILPLKKLSSLYLESGYYKKAANALIQLLSLDKYNLEYALKIMKLYRISVSESELELVLNELYNTNTGMDNRIKLEIAYLLRLKNVFVENYAQFKDELPFETKFKYELFFYLACYQTDIAKELLLSGKGKQQDFIQYYLISKDNSITTYVDENVQKVIQYLETENRKLAFNLDETAYLNFLEETLKLNNLSNLSLLLELGVLFTPAIKGKIATTLYNEMQYEMATEFFVKYLIEHEKDFNVTLLVAELYLMKGQEIDALKYAHEAMLLNDEHFRSLEIILEVYKALNEKEQAKEIATELKKHFPYDNYLNQF